MSRVSAYLKLPFSFDLAGLQHDLNRVEASSWMGHFNSKAYDSGWDCIPLRSVGGRLDSIIPVEGGVFEDTAILLQCPRLRQAIDTFQCQKTSVRLMALAPGAVIHEHRDDGASLDDGMTRLHIPVLTSPQVTFRIDGEVMHFSAGDTWYLNASCLHGVENRSAQPRVHLMIDCVTNPWLEQVFEAAGGVRREPPPYGDATIHDGNVHAVIAALRSSGQPAGARLADQLMETHARRHPAAARH